MRVASIDKELEKSLVQGLMAGAILPEAWVSGHVLRTHSACPHCGAAHEDEVYSLWDRLEWEPARETSGS